jgi:DNA repair exonuclease SbcCD ATPase subunit
MRPKKLRLLPLLHAQPTRRLHQVAQKTSEVDSRSNDEISGEDCMSDVLLLVILLVSTATFTLTIRALRSSRRSERFGEDHHDLLLDQQDQLRSLREGQDHERLMEELAKEREERLEAQQQLERLEQQLSEREQEERLVNQQQLERLEQQLLPFEQERQRLEEELSKLEQPPGKHRAGPLGINRFRQRRIIGDVVLLLLGSAAVWLTSLVVALYLLNP